MVHILNECNWSYVENIEIIPKTHLTSVRPCATKVGCMGRRRNVRGRGWCQTMRNFHTHKTYMNLHQPFFHPGGVFREKSHFSIGFCMSQTCECDLSQTSLGTDHPVL